MLAADAAGRRAEAIALLQLDGAELNDTIVQSLAATKWAIESGDTERAMSILNETIVPDNDSSRESSGPTASSEINRIGRDLSRHRRMNPPTSTGEPTLTWRLPLIERLAQ